MAAFPRLNARKLAGKVIDIHSHAGISTSAYLAGSYPYCQSVESLLVRMDANGVDCAVTFPYGEGIFFDIFKSLHMGLRVPAAPAISKAPYVAENRLLCEEVYHGTLGAAGRIMPFLCIDPARCVAPQVRELEKLAEAYPVYGLKVAGVTTHSSHRLLATSARAFVRFAEERNIPMLMHSTAYAGDEFCYNGINLDVARCFPKVRFCLAHCLGFDRHHLAEADALPNVWVDCAAMKIQVEADEVIAPPERRFASDYRDHKRVFRDLVAEFPNTMLWGSDSPAYSYVTRRRYPDGSVVEFNLHGTYAKEKAALDSLAEPERLLVAGTNSCRFLFG